VTNTLLRNRTLALQSSLSTEDIRVSHRCYYYDAFLLAFPGITVTFIHFIGLQFGYHLL
jgi:hypothetical protein